VIAEADWIIDLGPEGGVGGGSIVAATHPEGLVQVRESHTGAALRPVLARVANPSGASVVPLQANEGTHG
jgi:excinuclease ABC subunit A